MIKETKREEAEKETSSRGGGTMEVGKATTAGRFQVWFDAYPKGLHVQGPKDYMESGRMDKRLDAIAAGKDVVANTAISIHGNVALAVAVSLQTDYAAYRGGRQLERVF